MGAVAFGCVPLELLSVLKASYDSKVRRVSSDIGLTPGFQPSESGASSAIGHVAGPPGCNGSLEEGLPGGCRAAGLVPLPEQPHVLSAERHGRQQQRRRRRLVPGAGRPGQQAWKRHQATPAVSTGSRCMHADGGT